MKTNEHETRGKPRFETGQRVTRTAEEGRVQHVTYSENEFRYLVKWDNGPTTTHVEGELAPSALPPHYP
jgi:hypothetical protein